MVTILGPYVAIMLTSPGPHVSIVWHVKHARRTCRSSLCVGDLTPTLTLT